MSAAEIIEQIKRLPPEDKQAVREYLSAREEESIGPSTVESIDRKDLERTAQQIFNEHQQLFRKLAQ